MLDRQSHDSAHSSLFRDQCSSLNFGNADLMRRETVPFRRRRTFLSDALRWQYPQLR